MNLQENKYSKYALCREMMEASSIVRGFNQGVSEEFVFPIQSNRKIFITGEGSSRIFPAKHFIYQSLSLGINFETITDGALQAREYRLDDFNVFGVSNSGKTKELVRLFTYLKSIDHPSFFGITATPGSPVEIIPSKSVILTCGKEMAVAATKSVIEQALFFDSLLCNYMGSKMVGKDELAKKMQDTLEITIDRKIIDSFCKASIVYFSGRNDGVAEELALKTNEIARKKSQFLEGTFALHGIEEVMNRGELMIIIEPFEQEEQKFREVLVEGAGIEVIAIASRDTCFPTIRIPDAAEFKNYIELSAGWNLLVEVGLQLGIDLDKPNRARKIGNEAIFI